MDKDKDQNRDEHTVPETSQKREGTTSAYSAASHEEGPEVTGEQGRASFYTGSTTQGGSNFGQGSSQLGGSSYSQGSTGGAGSNYENEAGKFAETGTQADGSAPSSDDLRKQGGTETERDELSGDDRVANKDQREDTAGIP